MYNHNMKANLANICERRGRFRTGYVLAALLPREDGVRGRIFLLRLRFAYGVAPGRGYANAQSAPLIYRYFYLILGIIVRTVSVWVEIIFYKRRFFAFFAGCHPHYTLIEEERFSYYSPLFFVK